MKVVTPEFIKNKIVLLRLDIDVPLGQSSDKDKLVVLDDFRLKAGLPTLNMCLENAQKVIIMGHIGRPTFAKASAGKPEGPDEESLKALSVAPILDWLEENIDHHFLDKEKLFLLENLRFEKGEEEGSLDYAKELIALVDSTSAGNCVFINEAFASYHKAASTTVIPTLLPHCAGLRFAKEVEVLKKVREIPPHPLLIIIGGAKVEDKLPVVSAMAKIADAVLVGGKIAGELKGSNDSRGPVGLYPHSMSSVALLPAGTQRGAPSPATPPMDVSPAKPMGAPDFTTLPHNVFVGTLNEAGTDMTPETILSWQGLITGAKMIVWNGPVGKIEGEGGSVKGEGNEELGSAEGTYDLARMILESKPDIIIGGGDTIGFLGTSGLLDKFEAKGFISTGGGAMLKFLETGTLSTIEALK